MEIPVPIPVWIAGPTSASPHHPGSEGGSDRIAELVRRVADDGISHAAVLVPGRLGHATRLSGGHRRTVRSDIANGLRFRNQRGLSRYLVVTKRRTLRLGLLLIRTRQAGSWGSSFKPERCAYAVGHLTFRLPRQLPELRGVDRLGGRAIGSRGRTVRDDWAPRGNSPGLPAVWLPSAISNRGGWKTTACGEPNNQEQDIRPDRPGARLSPSPADARTSALRIAPAATRNSVPSPDCGAMETAPGTGHPLDRRHARVPDRCDRPGSAASRCSPSRSSAPGS